MKKIGTFLGILALAGVLMGVWFEENSSHNSPETVNESNNIEEQTSIIFLNGYTGYLDEYANWYGLETFTGCDYDEDGLTDRVYREEIAVDEYSYNNIVNWRIEFGNGDVIQLNEYIEDFLSISSVDLTGNGIPEIIISGCYAASTNPAGYGVAAVFTRKDNGCYESMPLPFPDSNEYGDGAANLTPCIRLHYEVKEDKVHLSSKMPELDFGIELDEYVRSDLSSFGYEDGDESVDNTTYPYEVKISSDANGSRCLEFYFEAFWKWSPYRIVITVGYHDDELNVDHCDIF